MRSTTTRKRERREFRTVGSLATGFEWTDRRKLNVSPVRFGRKGLYGPIVERMRVKVWKKRPSNWGTKKGL